MIINKVTVLQNEETSRLRTLLWYQLHCELHVTDHFYFHIHSTFNSMSHKEFLNNNNLPTPMFTLDLHGFTKSEAICRTTDFLDHSSRSLRSENAWVLIITGSGAHSSEGRKLF